MSNSGSTISNVSAAGAYARADMLVSTLPVRAIDPTRQRFQVGDQVAPDEAPVQPQADATESDGSSSQGKATGWGKAGFGLLGAFTSFLARVFAQSDTEAVSAAGSVRSGLEAYARAARTASPDIGNAEIIPPDFPRLSSGRALDLTV
ncbi:MAG TPA: hypothetical protein VL974_06185 [Magnetospirillum sp.]|nr:hypothetical protein [Magnetospirillum sp.]